MHKEKPAALMINVPVSHFIDTDDKYCQRFRNYYESMRNHLNPNGTFYHWISGIPVHTCTHVFVCFCGKVRYKAIVVEYIRNASPFEGWEKRNYLHVTGPVVIAPPGLKQKGFRGFRYSPILF